MTSPGRQTCHLMMAPGAKSVKMCPYFFSIYCTDVCKDDFSCLKKKVIFLLIKGWHLCTTVYTSYTKYSIEVQLDE